MISQSAYCLSSVFNFLTAECINAAHCSYWDLRSLSISLNTSQRGLFRMFSAALLYNHNFGKSIMLTNCSLWWTSNLCKLMFRVYRNELKPAADWNCCALGSNANTAGTVCAYVTCSMVLYVWCGAEWVWFVLRFSQLWQRLHRGSSSCLCSLTVTVARESVPLNRNTNKPLWQTCIGVHVFIFRISLNQTYFLDIFCTSIRREWTGNKSKESRNHMLLYL